MIAPCNATARTLRVLGIAKTEISEDQQDRKRRPQRSDKRLAPRAAPGVIASAGMCFRRLTQVGKPVRRIANNIFKKRFSEGCLPQAGLLATTEHSHRTGNSLTTRGVRKTTPDSSKIGNAAAGKAPCEPFDSCFVFWHSQFFPLKRGRNEPLHRRKSPLQGSSLVLWPSAARLQGGRWS